MYIICINKTGNCIMNRCKMAKTRGSTAHQLRDGRGYIVIDEFRSRNPNRCIDNL